jgi:hypothetical protein
MRMSLENGGPGSHHFPPLAPEIPRSRDLLKKKMRGGIRLQLGKRSLTGYGPRSIYIHHDPMLTETIPQATWRVERLACHEIVLRIASEVPSRSPDQARTAKAP